MVHDVRRVCTCRCDTAQRGTTLESQVSVRGSPEGPSTHSVSMVRGSLIWGMTTIDAASRWVAVSASTVLRKRPRVKLCGHARPPVQAQDHRVGAGRGRVVPRGQVDEHGHRGTGRGVVHRVVLHPLTRLGKGVVARPDDPRQPRPHDRCRERRRRRAAVVGERLCLARAEEVAPAGVEDVLVVEHREAAEHHDPVEREDGKCPPVIRRAAGPRRGHPDTTATNSAAARAARTQSRPEPVSDIAIAPPTGTIDPVAGSHLHAGCGSARNPSGALPQPAGWSRRSGWVTSSRTTVAIRPACTPSTTRWSAVATSTSTGRATTCPSTTTARSCTAPTAR